MASGSLLKTKSRIISVTKTSKVTKAMNLISSSKFQMKRKKFKNFELFSSSLKEILSCCVKVDDDKIAQFSYFKENESNKRLYIIFFSDLGLCGPYNNNMLKFVNNIITDDDDIIVIGKKGYNKFEKGHVKYDYIYTNESKEDNKFKVLNEFVMEKVKDKVYRSINVCYTKFINALRFENTLEVVFPLSIERKENSEENINNLLEPIFIPNKEVVIENLLPLYLKNSIEQKNEESILCELASRRNAMDTATTNAENLLDELNLSYNKSRQEQITNSINEIVACQNK